MTELASSSGADLPQYRKATIERSVKLAAPVSAVMEALRRDARRQLGRNRTPVVEVFDEEGCLTMSSKVTSEDGAVALTVVHVREGKSHGLMQAICFEPHSSILRSNFFVEADPQGGCTLRINATLDTVPGKDAATLLAASADRDVRRITRNAAQLAAKPRGIS